MSIEVSTEIKSNYLLAICRGLFDNNELFSHYNKIMDIAENNNLKAVLIDIQQIEGDLPSFIERFTHGVEVAKMQWKHDSIILIAIVGKEPFIDPERFGENVALNRGARGKVFTDTGEAVAWIDAEIMNSTN